MSEMGDLAPYTKISSTRDSDWQTDWRGFRYSRDENKFDIIIVGDSFTAGVGLKQSQTLAMEIERLTNLTAYPFTTRSFSQLLAWDEFKQNPPKYVIWQSVTEHFPSRIRSSIQEMEGYSFQRLSPLPTLQKTYYEFLKASPLRYMRASFRRLLNEDSSGVSTPKPILAVRTKSLNEVIVFDLAASLKAMSIPDDDLFVKQSLNQMNRFLDRFETKNIKLITLPVPVKAEIYQNMIPESVKRRTTNSQFFPKLYSLFSKEEVPYIDLHSEFRKVYGKSGPILYLTDGSHWSHVGVKIAANAIAAKIASMESRTESK